MKPTPGPTLNERTLADLVVRLVLFALLAILCWRIVIGIEPVNLVI